MPRRWIWGQVPPWMPSTVRAQAWEQFGLPSEAVSGEAPVSGRPSDVEAAVAELGQFGVDAAEAGVGPAVVGVPFSALVDLGAELVDLSLTSRDFRFGPLNVVGEAADLLEDGWSSPGSPGT